MLASSRRLARLARGLPVACEFSASAKVPRPLNSKKYGIDILHDPLWNKSMAFDMAERDRLGLRAKSKTRHKSFIHSSFYGVLQLFN